MKGAHHQTRFQSQPCDGCGGTGGLFVHTVRYRGKFQRLCTACVLKNHLGYFCPVCFELHDPRPPPHHARLMCLNCPSIAHFCCAPSNPGKGPYTCPSCLDPNFFNAASERPANHKVNDSDGESSDDLRGFPDDIKMAKQLVAAALIASGTVNKASVMARMEAERRVKEALLARKRAQEALERVAYLVAKEREEAKTTNTAQNNKRPTQADAPVSNKIKKVKVDGPPLLSSSNGLHSAGHLHTNKISDGNGKSCC